MRLLLTMVLSLAAVATTSQTATAQAAPTADSLGGRFGDYGLILIRVRDRAEALGMLAPDSATARGVFRADLSPWFTLYEGQVVRP